MNNPRLKRPFFSDEGSVMVFSLCTVIFLSLLGGAFLSRSVAESSIGRMDAAQNNALHLAEAAIDRAVINLRTETLEDDVLTETLSNGSYTIDEATEVEDDLYYVRGNGVAGGQERNIEAVFVLTPQSVFQFAVFGDDGVSVGGNALTDSYDSREGVYDEDNHDHNGDVGTNSAADGSISVSGSIFVDGQLQVGPDVDDPESIVDGFDPDFVTGGTSPPSDTQDVISMSSELAMPEVTVPGGLTCNDRRINGGTVTLTAGDYCYRNLDVAGGATFNSNGKVTIYITGTLSISGNSTVMGNSTDPTQMIVKMDSSGEARLDGTLIGTTKFYGGLYGPNSILRISGNAEVFGSVVARSVDFQGDAKIHYDEAMADIDDLASTYSVSIDSWRELNPQELIED